VLTAPRLFVAMAYYAPGTIIPSKLHLYQSTMKPCDVFPFLDLPGEIRNKIYDLVFQECLVDIRLGHQQQSDNETINGPFREVQKQLHKKYDRKNLAQVQRAEDKQPEHKIRQAYPKPDLKQQKQTSQLLQDQTRTEPQKRFKSRYRGRVSSKEGPLRMSHTISAHSGSTEVGTSAAYCVNLNFLLSSRQIYSEALCVLYAKTSFRFITPKSINRFLLKTPLRALQAIRGLEISYATYPEPELTKHCHMKVAADRNWATTCRQIRQKMTDLKKLRLHLELNEWPSQLGLGEGWARSILSLSGNGLDRVDVVLLHHAFSEQRLIEAARNLEIAMMSREGRIAKFAQEKMIMEARKEKKNMESKARKVLVIKMDNMPATKKAQKA
jgi:hypothetical protein